MLAGMGLGLPHQAYATASCTNNFLTGTYNAQVSNLNFLSVLATLNAAAGGSGGSSGSSGSTGSTTHRHRNRFRLPNRWRRERQHRNRWLDRQHRLHRFNWQHRRRLDRGGNVARRVRQ